MSSKPSLTPTSKTVPEISGKYRWRKITPDDGHYFFGYYDRNPWDHTQTRHLTLKIPQCDRIPERGEEAEIGFVDIVSGRYEPQTVTRAWCHQQGSMELWLPHRPNCFIYNDYDETKDRIVAKIFEVGRGVVGAYDLPVYCISPDGRHAASLNFARICRRGYSYADAVMPEAFHPDYDRDGIFILDLHTGESKLIVSYREMIKIFPAQYWLDDLYLWLNHIIFNCNGSKLLWLLRHCPDPLRPAWQTHMYTANLDGSDLRCPLPSFYWSPHAISHQIWGRTPNEILIDANWRNRGFEYVIFDERVLPLRAERISPGAGGMAHLIFSPDGRTLLADSYPDAQNTQTLHLVDAATGELEKLGTFNHERKPDYPVDTRCDLHPRWRPDGRIVTVDSIHDGRRGIYLLELPPVFGS